MHVKHTLKKLEQLGKPDFTVDSLAGALGVEPPQIAKLVRTGALPPHHRLGAGGYSKVWDGRELHAWLKAKHMRLLRLQKPEPKQTPKTKPKRARKRATGVLEPAA